MTKKNKIASPVYAALPRRPQQLTRAVASTFHVEVDALLGTTRGNPSVSEARQVLMWLLSVKMAYNFTQIGKLIGRYRRTVSHGVVTTRAKMKSNSQFALVLEELEAST